MGYFENTGSTKVVNQSLFDEIRNELKRYGIKIYRDGEPREYEPYVPHISIAIQNLQNQNMQLENKIEDLQHQIEDLNGEIGCLRLELCNYIHPIAVNVPEYRIDASSK